MEYSAFYIVSSASRTKPVHARHAGQPDTDHPVLLPPNMSHRSDRPIAITGLSQTMNFPFPIYDLRFALEDRIVLQLMADHYRLPTAHFSPSTLHHDRLPNPTQHVSAVHSGPYA